MKFAIGVICLLAVSSISVYSRNIEQSWHPKGRIISGADAVPGQFPWHVILKKDDFDILYCGASIISNSWVLTAAHCVHGFSSVYLMFGTVNLYDEEAVNSTSAQIYIHPAYDNEALLNDIALIRLPTPITYSKYIQPIPLVTDTYANYNFIGTTATVTGFGVMDDVYLDYSEVLQYAKVTITNNSECKDLYEDPFVDSYCARGYNGTKMSPCSGDSGGALTMPDSNGNIIQIGINSFVPTDSCTQKLPGAYVRLLSYLDFISQTMKSAQISS